jgi:hypothetical protein
LVAIRGNRHHIQGIARFLAFSPETLFAAAPEDNLPFSQRLPQGVFIHKTKHQHLFGIGVLDYSRHQAVHFLKI